MLAMLAVAVLLYGALALAIYAGQRRILFVPERGRPAAAAAGVAGLIEVSLRAADGVRLLAWWVAPPAGRPVLVYLHGNGGNLANRAARVRAYAEAGFGVLLLEYRGYGGNDGSPSEEGFALDARAAMAFVLGEGIESGRIAVYGESIGTGVAVRVAAEQAVGALVLESPYTSITDIARRRFWYLPVGLLLRDQFDSLSRIGRVRAPVLVLQGGRDGVVAPELGRRLFAAAGEPKELWVAPEGGHEDLMQWGAGAAVVGFLERVIRAKDL